MYNIAPLVRLWLIKPSYLITVFILFIVCTKINQQQTDNTEWARLTLLVVRHNSLCLTLHLHLHHHMLICTNGIIIPLICQSIINQQGKSSVW